MMVIPTAADGEFLLLDENSGGASREKELAGQCRRPKRLGFPPWAGTIPRRRAWSILDWRTPWTEGYGP